MAERSKYFHLRLTPDEHANLARMADSLGVSMSEMVRILARADVTRCSEGEDRGASGGGVLVVRFVEQETVADLASKMRRFGNLLNQATRALNDLRRRKDMSANYVAERLEPIAAGVDRVEDGMNELVAECRDFNSRLDRCRILNL